MLAIAWYILFQGKIGKKWVKIIKKLWTCFPKVKYTTYDKSYILTRSVQKPIFWRNLKYFQNSKIWRNIEDVENVLFVSWNQKLLSLFIELWVKSINSNPHMRICNMSLARNTMLLLGSLGQFNENLLRFTREISKIQKIELVSLSQFHS